MISPFPCFEFDYVKSLTTSMLIFLLIFISQVDVFLAVFLTSAFPRIVSFHLSQNCVDIVCCGAYLRTLVIICVYFS